MEPSTFLGIDLAWKSERNPSGFAVLRGNRSAVELVEVAQPLRSLDEVRGQIRDFTTATTIVAIDAPLIIANSTGQRPCEKAVGQRYGARDASCHTSNLTLYPNSAAVRLAHGLEVDGFVHASAKEAGSASRIILEVYPHAALVAMFNLERIIRYKKGPIFQKHLGLLQLRDRISQLGRFDPPLRSTHRLEFLLTRELQSLRGQKLKDHEDALYAVICAYLACYYWVWREQRTEIFGSLSGGYIIKPILSSDSFAPGANHTR